MRYVLKQQFWTREGAFVITNAAGQKVCWIKGKAFSYGHKLRMVDAADNELVAIEQKMFNLLPTFEIWRHGQQFAVLKRDFSLKPKLRLDVPGPNDYVVEGDLFEEEYLFLRQGREVARVTKDNPQWHDTYFVDMLDEQDHQLILATSVVIDLVCHPGHTYRVED